MSESDQVRALLDRYARAVNEKDVDALFAMYDDDVCVFDLWGRWSYDGAAAWRAAVSGWFGSLGDERVAVAWDDVRDLVDGDIASVHGLVTYTGLGSDGSELRAMQNRVTWVLRRRGDGGWRIAHEHTSAPADFETGKVTLRR